MDTSLLLTAIALAGASSLHCVGMCGPLAMVVPMPKAVTGWDRALRLMLYHAWRLVAYVLIGLVFLLSKTAVLELGYIWQLQQALALVMAGVAVLVVVIPFLRKRLEGQLGRWLAPLLGGLMQRYQAWKQESPILSLAVLGLLHGLVPCGMVYGAAAVFASTQPFEGAIIGMATFGVLTSVLLVSLVGVARVFGGWWGRFPSLQLNRKWVQASFMLVAAVLVLRSQGFLLLPEQDPDKPAAVYCHK